MHDSKPMRPSSARRRGDLRRAPQLAAQTDFAQRGGRLRKRCVAQAGGQRQRHAKVYSRLGCPKAACNVDDDVLAPKIHAGALYQHGDDHQQSSHVHAVGNAPGSGKR